MTTLELHDRLTPGLAPGRYVLTLEQKLEQTPWSERRTLEFTVSAPRLRLDGDEIHATYPPAGTTGAYRNNLPHVVLKCPTLPWDRLAGADGVPWLALLVLDEHDLQGAKFLTDKAGTLTTDRGPVFDPPLTTAETTEAITVLDIDAALLRRRCPDAAARPLLTHVRRVDDRSDRLAVVLAPRFPRPGSHTAALVSLEGRGAGPGGDARVRLVVLHQWRFTCSDAGGSFATLVGDERSPGLDHRPFVVASDDPALRPALARGHVPLAHRPAGAAWSHAWYRGPLTPLAEPPAPDASPALDCVPAPGVFAGQPDLSYVAAWQLGRLLALGSAGFGAAVRRRTHAMARSRLADDTAASATDLVEALAGCLAGEHGSDPDAATDPMVRDALELAVWLGDLVHLVGVPLRYLVACDRLLPPESLRLFHVDTDWTIDALAAGALSIAETSLITPPPRTRGAAREQLWRLFDGHRVILGNAREPRARLARVPRRGPTTGLLLRSRLLAEYPGVEIRLTGEHGPLEPVRREPVSNDVLLVLTRGVPREVELREPRAGLCFGRTGANHIDSVDLENLVAADGTLAVAKLAAALSTSGGAGLAAACQHHPTDITFTWEQPR